jgi:hypothetical protein
VKQSGPAFIDILYAGQGDVAYPNTTNLQQRALQKAYAKVGKADLALGEELGELRETIQTIRDPLRSLKTFLLADRERNWRLLLAFMRKDTHVLGKLTGRTGKASINAFADTWLELRYGLRPLMSLVQDIIEEVTEKQKKLFRPDKIRSVRAEAGGTFNGTGTVREAIYGYLRHRGAVSVQDEVKARASVQFTCSVEPSTLDRFGLSPQFLPETVLALTRLSFVVNWFISIEAWIQTLRVNPHCQILGNTVGVKSTRTAKMKYAEYKLYFGSFDWDTYSSDETYSREHYQRTCGVDLSYLPHFTWLSTFDLAKAIDSVALAWQFRPRRR